MLEAAGRLGGSLHTAEVGGVVVDVGAEAMLNRRPEAVDLAAEVGLAADLVHPATITANLWNRGRLVPMPRTLMGVPLDLRSPRAGSSRAEGLARAALDDELPADRARRPRHQRRRPRRGAARHEVVDRLVEPLLGGVYAGHAREISARGRRAAAGRAAGAGPLPDPGRRGRHRADPATDVPVFAGICAAGWAACPAAGRASRRHGAHRRDRPRAGPPSPTAAGTLVVGSTRDPEVLEADAVVLATPAPPHGPAARRRRPGAALELGRDRVRLDGHRDPRLPGRGLPGASSAPASWCRRSTARSIKASTFSFAKWDWVRAGRSTRGDLVVLRCSLGRHREEQTLQVGDEELVELALADLADAIGLSVRPVDTHVQRWGGALPQYAVGHLDRVAAVREAVGALPGLAVCGAAYDGIGIPACIASAHRAVAKIAPTWPARPAHEPRKVAGACRCRMEP